MNKIAEETTPVAKMTDEQCESFMKMARMLYASGKLPAWQIKRIEQIPGWTWTS
jgi:hypothetical protein